MEGIIHIRIDDRLIHGQVATQWTNSLAATRIMTINDEVASDPTMKSLLRIAAPANVSTSIISRETAINNISAGKYAGQRVLVIVKSPIDLVWLMDRGLEIKEVNVGNMAAREGTVNIRPTVNATAEELSAFHTLLDRGVHITAVLVPSAPVVDLKECLPA